MSETCPIGPLHLHTWNHERTECIWCGPGHLAWKSGQWIDNGDGTDAWSADITRSDLEQQLARRSGGESAPATEPTHPACRWPAGGTAAESECDTPLRQTDAGDERKTP